jgi:Tfp pilus assembly protein PilF
MLEWNPKCGPHERAAYFGQMGECFLRQRNFDKAEFFLQTSFSIDSKAKKTLKSLVSSIK